LKFIKKNIKNDNVYKKNICLIIRIYKSKRTSTTFNNN